MKKLDMNKLRKSMEVVSKKGDAPFPVQPVFGALEEGCTDAELRDAFLDLRADKQLFMDACKYFLSYFRMSLVSLTMCMQAEKEASHG